MSNEISDHEHCKSPDPVLASMRALSPAPCQLDRDQLMFLAGKASAGGTSEAYSVSPARTNGSLLRRTPGQAWIWPVAATVFAATSLVLGGMLAVHPGMPVAAAQRIGPIRLSGSATAIQESIEGAVSRPAPAAATRRAAEVAFPNYLRTREVAFRMGLDALGTPSSTATGEAPSYGELMFEISSAARPEENRPAGSNLLPHM
jgi:hypothetical protein